MSAIFLHLTLYSRCSADEGNLLNNRKNEQEKFFENRNVIIDKEADNYYSNNNNDIEKWFLMNSPWPVIGIAIFYLYFVLKLGPNFMSNKKAYSLRPLILFYNLIQVVFSSWWSFTAMLALFKSKTLNFMESTCQPQTVAPEISYEFDSMAWYYLMSKFVELFDTVFFVLRRKQNQVTFLHVYHHTNMAVSTWVFAKFIKGVQIAPIGICNTFVHILMYGYYLLAALGPKVHKYLWWKKYITKAQISQFLMILIYLGMLLSSKCSAPMALIVYAVCNTTSFLILFYKFYMTSYKKSTPSSSEIILSIKKEDNKCFEEEELTLNNNNTAINSTEGKKEV